MIAQDVRIKMREIQIYTRRLMCSTLVGDARSAQKGSGFDFDQIREYQQGDDTRYIDWKSSVRANRILIKQYIEERSRTIFLVVDISASSIFSSTNQLKIDLIAQVASVLALVGHYGKDSVGLLLFSDQVELFIPPAKTSNHMHMIMEQLFSVKPKYAQTNMDAAFDHLMHIKRRGAVIFVISDFIIPHMSDQWIAFSSRHEVVAIRCLDRNEKMFPSVGLLNVQDPETGIMLTIDSQKLNEFLHKRIASQNSIFRRHKIDCIDVMPDKEFIGDLIRFFRKRMRY